MKNGVPAIAPSIRATWADCVRSSSAISAGWDSGRALLPGAALLGVGHALLELATVLYLAPKLTRAPALYGSLGSAATLLLWLFLMSRIIVAAAFLNATLWRRPAVQPHVSA